MESITVRDFRSWGCPKCGFRFGVNGEFTNGVVTVDCGRCGHAYTVVDNDDETAQAHPRFGTLCNGALNKSPRSDRGFTFVADGESGDESLQEYYCRPNANLESTGQPRQPYLREPRRGRQ